MLICVFVHSRFIENPSVGSWETNPCFFKRGFCYIKDLKYRLDHASRYSVLSPPCELCGSLKGKLFNATKENTELKQEVAYLTTHLEKTVLSEKMVEDDLSRVEESATKSTYKLSVGF
jgi:hypothetical protein